MRRRGAGAGDPGVGAGEALAVDRAQYRGAQFRIEPARRVLRVGRIDREALDEELAPGGGAPRQEVEGGPRRLRVDVVGGHRRHPAPIVDPGGDHLLERVGHQIGRRLDVHVGPEDQPGNRDRPQMVGEVGLGRRRHAGLGLGAEILDDDFLDVPVALVEVAQRQHRLDALYPCLADADQDPRGERHRRFTRRLDALEAARRGLVGRAEMRARRGG